jgi:hypothetical protein
MSSSPESFTLFPNLPPELRLQIYREACHPRVTSLSYHPNSDTFHCPTHPPPLLHISREARAEGLRLYVKCFLPASSHLNHHQELGAGHEQEGREEEEEPRYFYHHPSHDTLYLPRPHPSHDRFGMGYADWAREFASRLPGVVDVVRRLAVDYVPGEVRRQWEVYGKVCLIRGCKNLEEAYLVISSSSGENGGGDGDGVGEEREVEFVDPGADDAEIMGIMERVSESCRVEIWGRVGVGLGNGDGDDGQGGIENGWELIPKAKVPSAWECRPAVCVL